MNRRIVVLGEHPANRSGFSRLTKTIPDIIIESELFEEVTVIGILGATSSREYSEKRYVVMSSDNICRSKEAAADNTYGFISLCIFLSRSKFTDVLLIGDPWMMIDIEHVKNMFPHVTFHYYCPCEGESLPQVVTNHMPSSDTKRDPRVKIDEILKGIDNVIAYSECGMKAINRCTESKETCKNFIFHCIPDASNEKEEIPRLSQYIDGKFVVGMLGRNAQRKSIDMLPFICKHLEKIGSNAIILSHMPKEDIYGFDIECIFQQIAPEARHRLLILEDIMPDIYNIVCGNAIVRDLKRGISDSMLEYLFSKFDAFLNMSRAEGFGFPIAEAMVRGIPTICNGYATPKELMECANTPDMAIQPSVMEFFAKGNNLPMAVPDPEAIARKIFELETNKSLAQHISKRQEEFARKRLLIDSPECDMKKMPNILSSNKTDRTETDSPLFLTSHMERCGIRTYTDNMMENMPGSRRIFSKSLAGITEIMSEARNRLLHVQFEPSLWDNRKLANLIAKMKVGSRDNTVFVTVHTTDMEFIHEIDGVADTIILHSDFPEREDRITRSNIIIHPHPIPEYNITEEERIDIRKKLGFKKKDTVLGINGFILPYKKVAEQASTALQAIKDKGLDNVKLFILGSAHENDRSGVGAKIIGSICEYANRIGMKDRLVTIYEFLPKREMATYLSAMDYALFYHNNAGIGAQSGSVRELLAAGVLPFVTKGENLNMHNDIIDAKCAISVQSGSKRLEPREFAASAIELLDNLTNGKNDGNILDAARKNISKYREHNSFRAISKMLMDSYKTHRI